MKDNRIQFIDIYRGIGIVFMIMGHIYFGRVFNIYIHAFHMPMFFFVSGFFYKENIPINKFIKIKIKSLIIPYIIFSLICSCAYCIYNGKIYYKEILNIFWFNNNGWMPTGPMWFLTALFFALILYRLIEYIPNVFLRNIIPFIVSTLGCMLGKYYAINFPWSIFPAFVAVAFIHMGKIMKQYNTSKIMIRFQHMKIVEIILLFIISLCLIILNGEVNMRIGIYGSIILFYLNAFLSIMILWNICQVLNKQSKHYFNKKINNILKYIGKNSLTFLCLNQCLIYFYNECIIIDLNVYLKKIIMLVIVICSCTIINEIEKRLRLLLKNSFPSMDKL